MVVSEMSKLYEIFAGNDLDHVAPGPVDSLLLCLGLHTRSIGAFCSTHPQSYPLPAHPSPNFSPSAFSLLRFLSFRRKLRERAKNGDW